ncbi:unnamed protein product [Auanema sp. JU1783]|nr:unnamed protein product [Auanema sp. JU1783]
MIGTTLIEFTMSTEKSFWSTAKSFFSSTTPVVFAPSINPDKRFDMKRQSFAEKKRVQSLSSNSFFIDSFGSLNMP